MTTEQGTGGRAYQRLLIDQANAEMGRQRISRRQLMRLTGIPDATMNRIFTCERDLNVTQWGAIAHALGFDPGELAKMAGEAAAARQSSTDRDVHPEDERVINESDQLTARQRSELLESLSRDKSDDAPLTGDTAPSDPIDSPARRRGRGGRGV